ncbi:MAG: hypothetical protein WCK98_06050 [bacterium]
MNTRLSQILTILDIPAKSGEVYELILKNSTITVAEICRLLGTNRIFVYRTLDLLVEKGLLESRDRAGGDFKLVNPNVVLTLLKQKQMESSKAVSEFEEYLPEILTNWHFYKEPVFKAYDGKDRFWMLFSNLIDKTPSGESLYMVGLGQDLYNIIDLPSFDNIWRPKRLAKNIKDKILARTDNPYFAVSAERDNLLRDWRVLPASFDKIGSIWIAADTIILWDTFNVKAFEIVNHTMAEYLKGLFEVIWLSCPSN